MVSKADNPVREIEAILSRGIGLDAGSVGPAMVTIAIQNRRKKRKISSDAEYAKLVASSPSEFQALVEEIVVPETWFFRDHESYAFLSEWSRKWLPSHPYHAMRVLSAPCASGEEPYSIAMTMAETGISPDRYSIEAVDISAVGLEKARVGVYGRNSFRGQPLDFRDKYFGKVGTSWRLNTEISKQVHFRQANIADTELERKEGELDVIFCRNLLIYFDTKSRARVMNLMHRALAPDGILFLGHAEGALAHDYGFEPIPAPMAFVFRKTSAHPQEKPLVRRPARIAAAPMSRRLAAAPPPPLARKPAVSLPAPVKVEPAAPADPQQLMAAARRMADEGRFAEARNACREVLKTEVQCADAYYLLALVEEAAGNETLAVEYYKKTLYIEPDHEETLVQLSLLERKQGSPEAARRLEERARRVRARKERTR